MLVALNALVGFVFAWVLYALSKQFVRGLTTGIVHVALGGWMLKGVVIRRRFQPVLYWTCMIALAGGVVVFSMMLVGLVLHWIWA
jgi:hypothetical protein